MPVGRLLRGAAIVASIGLALHLVLPQIPGIERSAGLILHASPLLVLAALAAEIASELCYSELLGRATGAVAGSGPSLRARRRHKIGPWFTLRLTVTGYGVAHVLPGGGAAASTVDFETLGRRGLERARVAAALALIAALTYSALGFLFAGSLFYLLIDGDLDPVEAAATALGLALVLGAFLGGYAAYRNPRWTREILARAAHSLTTFFGRVPPRGWTGRLTGERAGEAAGSLVSRTKEGLRAVHAQLSLRPIEAVRLSCLAFGYWAFDASCLILVFAALGVEADPILLLVAYGVATAAGSIPLTPGGIGIFETTMLATLALLGVGPEAAVPILGYRLFNFWMPIPLAAVFYPTLRRAA